MDKKTFDDIREKVIPDQQAALMMLIDVTEKIWNKLTSSPVDITQHDEHGAVKMEDPE